MYKYLIDSKLGDKYVGLIVPSSEYRELDCILEMRAGIKNSALYDVFNRPVFGTKLNEIASENKIVYFVISDIDKASDEDQRRFIPLVKDRTFGGYNLPDNVILIFTVENKETINNIVPELYWQLVLAF